MNNKNYQNLPPAIKERLGKLYKAFAETQKAMEEYYKGETKKLTKKVATIKEKSSKSKDSKKLSKLEKELSGL